MKLPADRTDSLGSSLKIVSAVGLLLRFLPQTKRTLKGCDMAGGGLGECPLLNVGRRLDGDKQPSTKNVGRHNECCDGLLFPPEQFQNIQTADFCNIYQRPFQSPSFFLNLDHLAVSRRMTASGHLVPARRLQAVRIRQGDPPLHGPAAS